MAVCDHSQHFAIFSTKGKSSISFAYLEESIVDRTVKHRLKSIDLSESKYAGVSLEDSSVPLILLMTP